MSATFVFDGDCGFCTRCARFAERWVPTAATIVPYQWADLAALRLTEAECEVAVQWVGDGVRSAGPEAIGDLLRSSRPAWRPVGWLLQRRPVLALAWPAYRWVSRHRHQLPGGTPACALPQ